MSAGAPPALAPGTSSPRAGGEGLPGVTLDAASFRRLRDIAYEQAGIALSEEKQALVSARVGRRLRALGLADERQYVEHLAQDTTGNELIHFLDAISTNFTSFWREPDHFQDLEDHARAALERGQTRLRYWSAACATGEEPYSMAMVLADALEARADWRILATDLSVSALREAYAGVYPQRALDVLPERLRARHATLGGGQATMSPDLQRRIAFRRLNLSRPPFPMQGPLDVVFCRNVMIYFDQRVRQGLVSDIERLLRPGGLLLIGHTETLHGLRTGMRLVKPSVYRLPEETP